MVGGWWEFRWIWWMRQNFVVQFVQLLRCWLCDMVLRCWSWITIGPILLPKTSCRHCSCWCISLICWAYFPGVMVLPGFRKLQWIRLTADHETVTMTIFWCKFGFRKYFRLSSWSNHWDGHCQLLYKIHFSSYITIQLIDGLLLYRLREDDSSKWQLFFDLQSALRHLLIELFYLSNFLQMPNNHTMVHAESLCIFSCSCKRFNFNDGSQLVIVNFQEPATALLIFKALISFAKLLVPSLHCTFVSNSWAKCVLMLPVASAALWPSLNLNEKKAWICFLSNTISLV